MALTKVKSTNVTFATIDWDAAIKTSNFTAESSKGYFVNTTSASVTIALPVGVVGTQITIQDYAGTFATNKVLLDSNGSEKIQGSTLNGQITTNNATSTLIYQDAIRGWTSQDTSLSVPLDQFIYLVIAGGGGGGCANGGGAGGGAGGYLTNVGGTGLSLLLSTPYEVTVGEGGAGGANSGNGLPGVVGSNSKFNLITSLGGGYGGGDSSQPGGNGGSGGGGARGSSAAGGSGTSSPQQGYDGGTGFGNTGGGGGGASITGANATSSRGGNGGNGLQNAITVASGTGPYYAGGGGGGMESPSSASDAGQGGLGGGGTGGAAGGVSSAPTIGTPNTGGGGGGSGDYNTGGSYPGKKGGSGVVILRYPSGLTITVPGTLTATTDDTTVANIKITTFTAGTGDIQFTS